MLFEFVVWGSELTEQIGAEDYGFGAQGPGCRVEDWDAVRELNSNCKTKETRFSTVYPYYGNLILFPNSNPDETAALQACRKYGRSMVELLHLGRDLS